MRDGHLYACPFERRIGEGGDACPQFPQPGWPLPAPILPHPMRCWVLPWGCGLAEVELRAALNAVTGAPFTEHHMHMRMFLPVTINRIVDRPGHRKLLKVD